MSGAATTARRAGFAFRIGRAVLAPQQATIALCRGEPGGLRDALALLPALLLLGAAPTLGLYLGSGEGSAGVLRALLGALGGLAVDVTGIVVGAVAMAVCLGPYERSLRVGLTLDLSAQAWLLWLFVQVLSSLVLTLLQHQPALLLRDVLSWGGLLLWATYWLLALRTARRFACQLADAPPQAARAPAAVGEGL